MGYRFQLDAIRHAANVARGATTTVSIDLRDVGWARIFSARKLWVTLDPHAAGSAIKGSGGDARTWPSQASASTSVDVAVPIPSGAAPGTYDVYVSLPDVWPSTASDTRQAVRFANANDAAHGQSWDDAKARMRTGTTITIE